MTAKVPRWGWPDLLALLGGIGLLCALVLPTIGRASIWFDEAFSAYITKFNFLEIARYTATDVHPPLYYWVLKLWEMVFGYDDAAMIRALSLVFAAIAAVFGYLLLRRLFGRKAAILGLLFIVLSPMIIRYSQEARMYMMESAIILAATYTLVRAEAEKKRKLWIVYGILVGLGMWTHYFTALAWLAHWVWRFIKVRQTGVKGKELRRVFMSKQWWLAHLVAVGIFVPWIPLMLYQLAIVQGGGFWIGPVGVDTPVNYLTNMFLYLEHGKVQGWVAVALMAIVVGTVVLARRVYRGFDTEHRQSFLLITCLALVPVALLILASLPPLRSSFVERYLIPSTFATMLLMGIVAAYGLAKYKWWQRFAAIIIVVILFILGLGSVVYYGNFNKNSNTHVLTGQVVQEIQKRATPGEPIIANSPWIFYEAVFYSTAEHPVYFIDADTKYIYGSLDMLKYSDQHKIKDLDAFLKEHPKVWYIDNTNNENVESDTSRNWSLIRTVSVHDDIQNVDIYKASEYLTNAE